jgi:hypothetical protein
MLTKEDNTHTILTFSMQKFLQPNFVVFISTSESVRMVSLNFNDAADAIKEKCMGVEFCV